MLLTTGRLPLCHGFSTREGGVSEGPFASLNLGRSVGDEPARVAENARRLAARVGLTPSQLVCANQVHGERLLEVETATPGVDMPPAIGDADGLFTRARRVALCIRTADCVPVLLYAPEVPAIAAVHAGWRGAVLSIPGKAVAELGNRYGAVPARMLAAIGPSIRSCCYEVGEEVAAQFEARFGPGLTVRCAGEGPRLDLVEACRRSLMAVGVQGCNIDVLPHCTACSPALFFSHRRDQGRSGRHLSFLALD
ncbi:MAG: peptidoglycan editing factor PgeF [Deltaproteobacteria bacterium]|nr:peptidoglycan editing factor PgeF [Deltaproteobacteria bacterium]